MPGGVHQVLVLAPIHCYEVASEQFLIRVLIGFECSTRSNIDNDSVLGQDKNLPRHGAPMICVGMGGHVPALGFLVGREVC